MIAGPTASTLDRDTQDPPVRASVHRDPLRIGEVGIVPGGEGRITLPPEVNLPHASNWRAVCGANLVAYFPKVGP